MLWLSSEGKPVWHCFTSSGWSVAASTTLVSSQCFLVFPHRLVPRYSFTCSFFFLISIFSLSFCAFLPLQSLLFLPLDLDPFSSRPAPLPLTLLMLLLYNLPPLKPKLLLLLNSPLSSINSSSSSSSLPHSLPPFLPPHLPLEALELMWRIV